MSSTRERAWLAAHQKGSKALVQRLDKAHANNPEYQAFKKKHGLGDTSSVKQVSKSTVDRAKEKARQTLAGKAYGATKGTRMGSAEGTGETLRDTIAPLTRDQHSAVKAAEREAKAAEKPAKPAAAPKKPAKPKKEKAAAPAPEKKKPSALELIAAAAAKRKINQPPVSPKALRRIAAVGDMEHDHGGFEDLGDTQYGGRHSYNEEAIVEGNDEDLRSKSDKELQRLHAFWKTRVELIPSPRNDVAKEQLAKIKAIFAEKKGKKIREEVEQIDEITITNVTPPRGLPGKSSAEMGREYREAMKKWNEKNPPGKYDPEAHMKNVLANLKKEEVEQVDEGMLDDYIEGKIAKHHANKHNPEINAAHADAAEVTKKINPFKKKIAQIKKRVSYKNKTHPNYAKTRADLKAAAASIQPLDAERSKHYDRIRDARNKRDSNTDSDVDTYHKWGIVGLGVKKLKQKLTKEEAELDEEINNRITKIHVRGQNVVIHRYDTEAKGTYKKVFHHHSPAAAQQYARKLQKGSMSNPKLVIEGVEQIDETARDWKKAFASVRTKNLNKDVGALRTQVSRYDNATREDAKNRKKHLKNDLASLKKEEVEQVDEIYALSAANYQAELRRQEKAKIEHKKNLERKAKEQLDKDSEDTGNPFANWKPVKEAKKHHMGGALFTDTAARLQKAINAHKERMDQMTNGPEHEYHHPTLDIRAKSRVKFPAPWVKVEDK